MRRPDLSIRQQICLGLAVAAPPLGLIALRGSRLVWLGALLGLLVCTAALIFRGLRRTRALTVAAHKLASGDSGPALALAATIPAGSRNELHQFAAALAGVATHQKQREEKAALELRECDQRKDEFLALLSHELRNPLTPLRNNLFLLHRAPPGSSQAAQALTVLDRQISHLVFLVDDLLEVGRISRGVIRLQCSDVDLVPLLRDAAQDAETLFAGRGVQLQLQIPAGAVVVHADPMRLTQVVGNLLHNAGKFTPADGMVTLGLDADAVRRVAHIWVRDTGVGIDVACLPRLFEPFTQAAPSLARSGGGLGLGLTLVRRLVELHGGSVSGFSEGLGRGAQFTVELPLTEARPAAPISEEAVRRAPRRVLVIEDNADAAESLRSVLEFMGHRVQLAGDGRTGVQRAREFEPEIVFCDIGLPQMDGYAVARALRAESKLRDVFLVAMTGYALPEDQRKAAEAGFHEHVAKPPSIERLEDLLARASLAWSETGPRSGGVELPASASAEVEAIQVRRG
jgi:two-component system CheB/CheR fusion protein